MQSQKLLTVEFNDGFPQPTWHFHRLMLRRCDVDATLFLPWFRFPNTDARLVLRWCHAASKLSCASTCWCNRGQVFRDWRLFNTTFLAGLHVGWRTDATLLVRWIVFPRVGATRHSDATLLYIAPKVTCIFSNWSYPEATLRYVACKLAYIFKHWCYATITVMLSWICRP